MIRPLIGISAAALALGGCASDRAQAPARPMPREMGENTCNATLARSFIGQVASVATGAAMMQASGATQLRWAPPRTALTMMFVNGRLTVAYDDDMKITRVSCN